MKTKYRLTGRRYVNATGFEGVLRLPIIGMSYYQAGWFFCIGLAAYELKQEV